ncbi:MAG: DUF3237 family protein [Anaerolineaceae bacterium]|nr:MAG: DUF3237 family protein [Anaerolineaceae bacterium]
MNQQQLFSIELNYEKGKQQVLDTPGRTGEYLGSGVGTISGEKAAGSIQWDLFEKVEEIVCESNLRGLIETDDGAIIQFDTLGFFRRPTQPDNHIWINASAVTFHTDDPRYAWLNELTGSWQGTFDMASYQHSYQIFIPGDA